MMQLGAAIVAGEGGWGWRQRRLLHDGSTRSEHLCRARAYPLSSDFLSRSRSARIGSCCCCCAAAQAPDGISIPDYDPEIEFMRASASPIFLTMIPQLYRQPASQLV